MQSARYYATLHIQSVCVCITYCIDDINGTWCAGNNLVAVCCVGGELGKQTEYDVCLPLQVAIQIKVCDLVEYTQ